MDTLQQAVRTCVVQVVIVVLSLLALRQPYVGRGRLGQSSSG